MNQDDVGVDITERDTKETTWFQTYSGIRFYPWVPSLEMVTLDDVAHHTACANRWCGATKFPISVAYHEVMCWRLAMFLYPDRKDIQKWALFHDAGEAYVIDLIRPVKRFMPEYRAMEEQVLKVLHVKFDLTWPMPDEVHYIDNLQLSIENRFAVNRRIQGLYNDLYTEFVSREPQLCDAEFLRTIDQPANRFWFMPEEIDWRYAKDSFLMCAHRVGVVE